MEPQLSGTECISFVFFALVCHINSMKWASAEHIDNCFYLTISLFWSLHDVNWHKYLKGNFVCSLVSLLIMAHSVCQDFRKKVEEERMRCKIYSKEEKCSGEQLWVQTGYWLLLRINCTFQICFFRLEHRLY